MLYQTFLDRGLAFGYAIAGKKLLGITILSVKLDMAIKMTG